MANQPANSSGPVISCFAAHFIRLGAAEDGMKALATAVCLATSLIAPAGHAQSYPAATVRIIVPYPPGGPTDLIARLCAQHLSEALGRQFYVENIAGASGARGAALVAAAPGDGHTLVFATNDLAVTATLSTKIQYDP